MPELLRLLVVAAERGWTVPRVAASSSPSAARRSSVEPARARRGRRAAGLRRLRAQRVRVRRVPQHARGAPPGQRRPAAAARARARRRRRPDHGVGRDDARLPRRRAAPRRARSGRPATSARSTPTATSTCAAALRNIYITSFGRNVAPEWVEREIAQRARHPPRDGARRGAALRSRDRQRVRRDGRRCGDDRRARSPRRTPRLPDYAQVRRWVACARALHASRTAC